MKLVGALKSLSDLNRLRILNILFIYGKSCNCDLEAALELNQSNASRHILKLKNEEIIICEKKAKWSYYSINSKIFDDFPFILNILNSLEDKVFKNDKIKFEKLKMDKERCSIL